MLQLALGCRREDQRLVRGADRSDIVGDVLDRPVLAENALALGDESAGGATISGSIGGNWLVSIPADMRVTAAGMMTLLLMPCSPPSIAAVFDRPMKPALHSE